MNRDFARNSGETPHDLPSTDFQALLAGGLFLLIEAYDCARRLKEDPWEFAVEVGCLRASGLTNTHLRWLLRQGFAFHAVESSQRSQPRRAFETVGYLSLPEAACFVLTEAGVAYARGLRVVTGEE